MKVSVIMAAYNAEQTIDEAVQSILNQTYNQFEFLIVNDGSTDLTDKKLEAYNDPRIRIISQENKGCVNATTRAFNLSKGQYIAIMDADDISLPERLERSVNFLDNNPSCVVVGTGYINRNIETGTDETVVPPGNDRELRRFLLSADPFKHPSIMVRSTALKKIGGYNTKIDHGFDYELYSRLAKVGKLANIPEVHLIIRQHKNQFFRMGYSPEEHRKRRLLIRWLTLWRLKPPFFTFVKILIWLLFEFIIQFFSVKTRHIMPASFRNTVKNLIVPQSNRTN